MRPAPPCSNDSGPDARPDLCIRGRAAEAIASQANLADLADAIAAGNFVIDSESLFAEENSPYLNRSSTRSSQRRRSCHATGAARGCASRVLQARPVCYCSPFCCWCIASRRQRTPLTHQNRAPCLTGTTNDENAILLRILASLRPCVFALLKPVLKTGQTQPQTSDPYDGCGRYPSINSPAWRNHAAFAPGPRPARFAQLAC